MFLGLDFLVLLVFVGISYYYLYKKYAGWAVVVSSTSLEEKGISIYEMQQNLSEKGIKTRFKVIKNPEGDKNNPFVTALEVTKKDYDEASTFVKVYKMRE